MAKMTASLLQAYDWYLEHPIQKSLDSIYDTLTKGFTGSPATVRGEKYESYVNQTLLEGKPFNLDIEANALCKLERCSQQDWMNSLTVSTKFGPFVFRGRLDFLSEDTIYDLKTTKKFREEDYHKKWQHTIYALAMNRKNFEYIVAVFPDDTGLTPTSIHTVKPEIKTLAKLTEHTENCVKFLLDHFKDEFSSWSGWYDTTGKTLQQKVTEEINSSSEVIF